MCSGPVVPMIWQGVNAVTFARLLSGKSDPKLSAPGTIRGDYCIDLERNLIHGSDSVAAASREISLWFGENEMIDYSREVVNC